VSGDKSGDNQVTYERGSGLVAGARRVTPHGYNILVAEGKVTQVARLPVQLRWLLGVTLALCVWGCELQGCGALLPS
jgi:hypothetical protein